MAYIDLTPSNVSCPTSGWTQLFNLIELDSTYTTSACNTIEPMYMEFYTAGHNNPLLPQDSVINGLEIFYTARCSGAGFQSFDARFHVDNTRSSVGSSLSSSLLSNTPGSSTIGGSSIVFSQSFRWVDINELSNGLYSGNPWFGLSITPTASGNPIWIDQVFLRLHYTQYGYLVGSRSKFYLGRNDLPGDVIMVNNIAQDTSYIPRKGNGVSSINQVKSSDVNILGDALYNIESAILSSSGYAYALDLKKTYVFSITVSANCDSANSITDALVYAKIVNNGNTYSNIVNLYNVSRTVPFNVSGTVTCYWTSAIAWLQDSNGNTSPLYANAQAAKFMKTNSGVDFIVGITALASSLGTVEDYDDYESSSGVYQGYIGSRFTAAATSGRVFFKVMAIGREV